MQSVYLQRNMKKNAAKGYKKTKPIQTQFPKSQKMNANSLITKDYRKKDDFAVPKNKPNSNPIKPNLETTPGQAGLNIMAQIPRGQTLLAAGYVAGLINKLVSERTSARCRLCSRI